MSGFSLVELLVALAICALLSGAIAGVAPHARAAFDATPEVLDIQQRERTVADLLTRTLRSAALITATRDDGTAGEKVPTVVLLDPDEDGTRFHAVHVLSITGHGRGVLDADQSGPSTALRLQPDANCPQAREVCGFARGATAIVADVDGRFDVFTIAATNQAAHTLSPSAGFDSAYPAGAVVVEVSADLYRLVPQADGSATLVRETAAGAVQPIVDNLRDLSFVPWRLADVLKRIDITVRLGARSTDVHRRVPELTRRLSISLRNPS